MEINEIVRNLIIANTEITDIISDRVRPVILLGEDENGISYQVKTKFNYAKVRYSVKDDHTVMVRVYHQDYDTVYSLMKLIRQTLDSYKDECFEFVIESLQDGFVFIHELYHYTIEYSVAETQQNI